MNKGYDDLIFKFADEPVEGMLFEPKTAPEFKPREDSLVDNLASLTDPDRNSLLTGGIQTAVNRIADLTVELLPPRLVEQIVERMREWPSDRVTLSGTKADLDLLVTVFDLKYGGVPSYVDLEATDAVKVWAAKDSEENSKLKGDERSMFSEVRYECVLNGNRPFKITVKGTPSNV